MSNYTPKMVAALEAAAPLNLEIAKDLAADFGVSHRSVISKAKSLGLEYVKASPKARAAKGITKAELTDAIRQAVALPDRSGDLTKAELVVLSNLS
jgi:Zn-dependent peptidase ImmA (M78 family)